MSAARRRRWLRWALLAGLVWLAASGGVFHRVWNDPYNSQVRPVIADDRSAEDIPLDAETNDQPGWSSQAIGVERRELRAFESWFERKLGAPTTSRLTFSTERAGRTQRVECLLLTPDKPGTEVVLYLASSGSRQGWTFDIEAMAAYRALGREVRMLVVPLPAEEQRGPGWQALATLDLPGLEGMLRQSVLDLTRAVRVCQAQGWEVTTAAGYSLGALFMASAVGLRPDVLDPPELVLWGMGADLELLAELSEHRLARLLRGGDGIDEGYRRRLVARLDPLTHLRHARVNTARLIAGRKDAIIPPVCVEALAKDMRAHHIETEIEWVDGGHYAVIGVPTRVERIFM